MPKEKTLCWPMSGRASFLQRFVGSEELINGIDRWCLWLVDANPEEWRGLSAIKKRVDAVKTFRLKSTAAPTKKAAERPATFFYQSQPASSYIAIPEVSSENRTYIPIAFLPPSIIASNKLYLIESSDVYLFVNFPRPCTWRGSKWSLGG